MRIVLIGFMATGKSSVAPLLADTLGLESVEMDDLIVRKGGKSIQAIFEAGGESAFRDLETAVAKDLQARDNVVISTGGGVVTRPETMRYLAANSTVVELSGAFATLNRRLGPGALPRPLFKTPSEARALYVSRQPLYRQYAQLHLNTDGLSVDQVAAAIAHKLQKVARP